MTLSFLKTLIKAAHCLRDKVRDSECVPLWLSSHTLDLNITSLLPPNSVPFHWTTSTSPMHDPPPTFWHVSMLLLPLRMSSLSCSLPRPFSRPSLLDLHILTFQEPDWAFPSLRNLLWLPVVDWDDHSTWGHSHPGTPTPKHHCLFPHWTHSFLC